ncbi:MAG TPA: Fic family protein [Solirubrobacteraceae bacterium]|jgi:Fic family protein|nr:Fic family protein [Solirubrobacteraceae bacterium]
MPPATESAARRALGRHEERYWPADPTAPLGGQRGGAYEVFIPDPIAAHEFTLDGETVGAVAEATKALGHLNDTRPQLTSLAALARNLLRAESAASSRIEGVKISHKRLARAAYARADARAGARRGDNRAAEVLGNVEAMEHAIDLGTSAEPLTIADVQDIHRKLLRFTDDREIAGVLRTKQSWIGGNDYNPIGAPYVGPPHEHVHALVEDLCVFVNRTDLAAVAQAAIAHAQFENIHPFIDGNGRTGRALIYTVLRRRGEISNYIPPISLVLGSQPKSYVGGLGAYSRGKLSSWCARFAHATVRASSEAERLAQNIEELQAAWLKRLGEPRRDAAIRELVRALPEQPIIDVAAAQQLTGKSHVAVGNAIAKLEGAGILKRLNERKWGRVWECGELLALVDAFEKSVSTS